MNKKDLYREITDNNISNYWNVCDEYKGLSLDELRNICSSDRLPFAVCAINITGDLNVGMMMRTALILGAERFFVFGNKKFDRRSTVGAQNYFDVVSIKALEDEVTIDTNVFHATMAEYNYTPVFCETNGTPLREFNWKEINSKICLVFGNEGLGIPKALLENQKIVTVEQKGVLRSLNVAAAASILMHNLSINL